MNDNKKFINFSGIRAFSCHKPKLANFFKINSLQRTALHLVKYCYFEEGNLTVYRPLVWSIQKS